LSVQPLTAAQFNEIVRMGGGRTHLPLSSH
jgi:hypothetical protein